MNYYFFKRDKNVKTVNRVYNYDVNGIVVHTVADDGADGGGGVALESAETVGEDGVERARL